MPLPPSLSRRRAVTGLVAATAAGASGCTGGGPGGGQLGGPGTAVRNGAGPDVDLALAGVVARGEQALLDLVTATVDRHPTLSAALAGAEAGHRTHLALLAGAVPGSAAPTPA
ncbi:MAG: hypothetical protein WB441_16410, partial [Nocardioidaceae bacterium]